jgi:hypothetical protein
MPTVSKFKLALLATTAVIAFGSISFAQTATEKSTIAAPVTDPAAKADPDMARVLAALAELGPEADRDAHGLGSTETVFRHRRGEEGN